MLLIKLTTILSVFVFIMESDGNNFIIGVVEEETAGI